MKAKSIEIVLEDGNRISLTRLPETHPDNANEHLWRWQSSDRDLEAGVPMVKTLLGMLDLT